MNKYFPLYLSLFLIVAMTLFSCSKKDEPSNTIEDNYKAYSTSSTLVSSFSLQANPKIASNLDSVRFTIDQDRGVIYNADSLAYGTRINALCVKVTCASTVASRQFIIKNGQKLGDTTIVYNTNKNDSIDFTGDVTLRITSYDGQYTRDYSVKLNVHKEKSDTIVWNEDRRCDLPNVSSTLMASKTVMFNDEYLCLINDNNNYVLNTASDPLSGDWNKKQLSLSFVPDVSSFTATDEALFILDENGTLYTSADAGTSWSNCGVEWHSIIGGYANRVLGVRNVSGVWQHDEYPQREGFVPETIEPEFPIEGMSPLVMASNEWTSNQQAMTMGGVLADGLMTNIVWGYDGERWGEVSNTNDVLPVMRDATLFCYYTYVTPSGAATPVRRMAWMIMGGKLASGEINTTTYVSRSQCITWSKGDVGVQKPSYLPSFYGAQVFVYERQHTASNSPRLASYDPGHVTPIVDWDCPYIYLFGGYGSDGLPLNSVWEGVLRRLTYKPVF